MSKRKDDGTGELDEEQLSDVSGGAGDPVMEEEAIVSPSGQASGKRKYKEISVTILSDAATPKLMQ